MTRSRSTPASTLSRTRRSPSGSTTSSIARAARAGQRWISTLDIHRDDPPSREIARARTCAAFVAAGGAVLYGTDLGNGDQPVGVNRRANSRRCDACGVSRRSAASPRSPIRGRATDAIRRRRDVRARAMPPATLDDVPAWLGGATVVPTEELVHDDH